MDTEKDGATQLDGSLPVSEDVPFYARWSVIDTWQKITFSYDDVPSGFTAAGMPNTVAVTNGETIGNLLIQFSNTLTEIMKLYFLS